MTKIVKECPVARAEETLHIFAGRWKVVILAHLFKQPILRLSELERLISGASQRMLIHQLRNLEDDGLVNRRVWAQVPPKVEYSLTEVGLALGPALEAMLQWAEFRDTFRNKASAARNTKGPAPEEASAEYHVM